MKRQARLGEVLLSVLLWCVPMLVGVGALVLYHVAEGHSVSEAIADGSWAWVVGGILVLLVVRHYVRGLSPDSRERGLRGFGLSDSSLAKAKGACPHCGEKLTGFIVACPSCGNVIERGAFIMVGLFILLAFGWLAYAYLMSR